MKEGEEVRHSAEIGKAGTTGRSTAPHVHYAVQVAGTYVDPESFMRLRLDRSMEDGAAAQLEDKSRGRQGRR